MLGRRRNGAILIRVWAANRNQGDQMKAIRVVVALAVFAITSALSPAGATPFSTDQSDLWWNPNESGWGIQFVQRGSVIFATMFVYDSNKIPYWYTATLNSQGGFTWSGDLVATTGPWFGTVPFNSATVTVAKVGTMTWTAQSVTAGVLSYSAAGISVGKNLVRQPIGGVENYSGHYAGGTHTDTTGCFNPSLNGTVEAVGIMNVSQLGTTATIQILPTSGPTCTYSGIASQAGQMGAVNGSYSCTDGSAGTFAAFEVQVNTTAVTGRFNIASPQLPGCQGTGWFGGMRVTTF